MSHASQDVTGESHGSVKSYLIGFILSIILTIIPFGIVMRGGMAESTVVAVLVICAIVQVLIQLGCFLHLNTSSAQRWNLLAILFTGVLVLIVIGGSLWVMYWMNANMMVM